MVVCRRIGTFQSNQALLRRVRSGEIAKRRLGVRKK